MKKQNFYTLAIAAICVLSACNNPPKGDNATIVDKQKTAKETGAEFTVDTADSRVTFTGHGVGKNHKGKFRVSSGTVAIENNQITGGKFIINMKSMDLNEKGGMYDEKLKPHLMSGDFFDVEKFNESKFEITDVRPYDAGDKKDTSIVDGANFEVSGNLTLKGVTKNVSFPARIDLDDNTVKAKANFDIDRTQWQMNYGNDKTLGNKFISEKVNIELDLKANRGSEITGENTAHNNSNEHHDH
jgi:polyisoprenoid-binding protein YceI